MRAWTYFILLSPLISSCMDGKFLMHTEGCKKGQIKQGNQCVYEEAALKGAGECVDPDLSKVLVGVKTTLCDGSIGVGTLAECSSDGEQDCVAKAKFKALDSSKLDASKIASGTTIAGVTGTKRDMKQCRNYSALATFDSSYPPSNLGWNTYTFAPANVATASNQITIASISNHGLVTNSPVRFTSSGTMPAPLVANTTYYAIYVSDSVIQVASVINGAQIDITSQGTGTHTAHDAIDSTAQYFDTNDDYNNNLSFSPANNPWISGDYLCDATNFVNVTSTSAPLLPSGIVPSTGNQAFTQIWQDQLTGMYVSNILYDSIPLNRNWSDAIRTCESLNGGTAGDDWRLPTQKELMQLHINGISKVSLAGGTTNNYFWSSSGVSNYTNNAWILFLSDGDTGNYDRGNTSNSALCVR